MKVIRSADNPLVRRLLGLRDSARERREEGLTVIEGAHLLEAFLDNTAQRPEVVVVSESSVDEGEMTALQARLDAKVVVSLDDGVFGKISPVAGRNGVLAIIPMPAASPSEAIAASGFQLWLDGVQDPGNVGSLIRTAAAAAASAVLLGPGCADPWSPKCLRGGMGGQFATKVAVTDDLAAAVRSAKGRVLAAGTDSTASVFTMDLTGDVVVVLGSEADGVQPEVAAAAAGTIGIPMPGNVESLNVGAAGAVICFERLRQLLARG
ncbi:MAG: RNA methyltransferase [Burkholderiales bacterium]|nr:RNA methyltransferase [Burkholderiales bacterium]